MTIYRVELHRSFDRVSSILKTYDFDNEKDAKEFVEEGNQILTNSRAFDCGLYTKKIEFNIVDDVNKELNQLKERFKNYRH